MKKQILPFALLLLSFVVSIGTINAQCPPDNSITTPGIYQNTLYCFTRGAFISYVWQIKDYDNITAQGATVNVDSIRIDSLVQLPAGLKWTTNKQTTDTASNNKFTKLENGCIWIYGVCTDSAGTYNTDIYVTAYVHNLGAVPQHLSTIGTFVRTRVLDSAGICSPPDTSNFKSSTNNKFGPTYITGTNSGIGDISENVANLTNYPNPFGSTTEVVFTTSTTQNVTFRVYDLVGKTLHEENLVAAPGKNTVTFNRKGLTNGIYFYSISDGTHAVTSKMVIAE